jgi:catechol 2,3-dioxygenase-like lactoylglutathione lyase family enzyme
MSDSRTVHQLRVVVEAADYDAAVAFYRDALGMPELAAFAEGGDDRVAISTPAGPPRARQPGSQAHHRPVEARPDQPADPDRARGRRTAGTPSGSSRPAPPWSPSRS